jgi:hypothetical protein
MTDPLRRCLFGMDPITPEEADRLTSFFLGAMFTAAGLIWWMLLCP